MFKSLVKVGLVSMLAVGSLSAEDKISTAEYDLMVGFGIGNRIDVIKKTQNNLNELYVSRQFCSDIINIAYSNDKVKKDRNFNIAYWRILKRNKSLLEKCWSIGKKTKANKGTRENNMYFYRLKSVYNELNK